MTSKQLDKTCYIFGVEVAQMFATGYATDLPSSIADKLLVDVRNKRTKIYIISTNHPHESRLDRLLKKSKARAH